MSLQLGCNDDDDDNVNDNVNDDEKHKVLNSEL